MTADLDLIVDAARAAADLALGYFGRDPRSWAKESGSVVSEADIAVDRLLAERLRSARPGYGWLSEETADAPDRLARRRLFVVDPIDGTRAFLSGRREWCVALAVVEDQRPVAAVLAAPALGHLFSAVAGGGADRDGRRLPRLTRTGLGGARLAGPRRHARPVAEAVGLPAAAIRFVPSLAYRLALVASGEVDIAISGPNANDWDIAAADLLVHEAGARLIALDGGTPRYNRAGITHPLLVAAAAGIAGDVAALIRSRQEEAEQAP